MKKLLSLILAFALICTLIPAVSASTPELQLAGKTGVYVGERIKWTANQWVSWNSGNPGVATIDANGNIVAHKAGKTNITATAANGAKKTVMLYVYNNEYTVKMRPNYEGGGTVHRHNVQPVYLGYRAGTFPVIAITSKDSQIYLAVEYCGNKYIYMNKVSINADGVVRSFLCNNVFRQMSNGKCTEYEYLHFTTAYGIDTLEKMANARNLTITFSGTNGSSTVTLSATDKQAIRDVLNAYSRMD
ncbi:MAG: Ig-like domain-containing protein [Oscillospiraceae bacterium]|nr:Ig-like domain-containing protein [Oscillospiraceae bacterium]